MSQPIKSIHTKRLDTYASRLMILLAVNGLKTTVDLDVVQYATELADWQLEIRKEYDPIDADNMIAKLEEKIRRALRNGAMRERDLMRKIHAHRSGRWAYDRAKNILIKTEEVQWDKKQRAIKLLDCHH
jgi:hypothetical protein